MPLPIDHRILTANPKAKRIEATMFVDIRELSKHPEEPMVKIPSIVRLQSLDECKRFVGNPRKIFTEHALWDGRTPLERLRLGDICPQGELGRMDQFGGEASARTIPLDKIEEQVIQGGAALIENLSRDNGDVVGRLIGDAQCVVSIRLTDDFVRVCATVFGAARIEEFTVLHCPNDFEAGGSESIAHREGPRVAQGLCEEKSAQREKSFDGR